MKKGAYLLTACLLSYIMGIHDGYIALWKSGDEKPIKVYAYQAASLPPADQQRLKEGIVIEDDGALIRLIEDYLS